MPFFLVLVLTAFTLNAAPAAGLKKITDVVIYTNDLFHCAFPSVIRRLDGELIVAFRRAPDRRRFGEKSYTHTDADSQLVLVRSRDEAATWSRTPALIYANPFGGSQDPCLIQLRDRSILCTSYGWAPVTPEAAKNLTNIFRSGNFAFLGGYLLRSLDGGHAWQDPIIPNPLPQATVRDIFGKPVPAYNRGAPCESANGRLYWVVANADVSQPGHISTYLMISSDHGETWNYACPVAKDDKVSFNETSLYETPKGDLVAFMRSENFNDHACIARSTDGGKTFGPWRDAGFQGHPLHALRLPDKRVLLVYGYRHAPFGVRARLLDPECTDFSGGEIILREDGGNGDLGYPWATLLAKGRVLVVYYFNQADGPRFIAGTILQVD